MCATNSALICGGTTQYRSFRWVIPSFQRPPDGSVGDRLDDPQLDAPARQQPCAVREPEVMLVAPAALGRHGVCAPSNRQDLGTRTIMNRLPCMWLDQVDGKAARTRPTARLAGACMLFTVALSGTTPLAAAPREPPRQRQATAPSAGLQPAGPVIDGPPAPAPPATRPRTPPRGCPRRSAGPSRMSYRTYQERGYCPLAQRRPAGGGGTLRGLRSATRRR